MNNANIEKNEETLFAKSFVEEEEIGPTRRPMARITGNKTYSNNDNNNNRFTDANSNDNYNRYNNNSYDTNSYNNNSDPPRRSTARITGNKTYNNNNDRYTDTNSNENYNSHDANTNIYDNNSDPPRRPTARITGNETYSRSNDRYTGINTNENYSSYNNNSYDTHSYNKNRDTSRRPTARITGNKTYSSSNDRYTDGNSNENYNSYNNNSYDTNSYNNDNSDPPRRPTARITGNKTSNNNRYNDINSHDDDTASYDTVNNNDSYNSNTNRFSNTNSDINKSYDNNNSDSRHQFHPRNDFARDRGKTGPNSRARGQRHRKPAFIFSDELIERSKLLQEFIRLGVDLRQWEKSKREKGKVPEEIMLLSWKVDVAPIIRHLREFGIEEKAEVARIFTKNPMILIFGPSVLKEKTDYLLKKKFTKDQIGFIIKRGLQFLSRSVEAMDGRFGFFQQSYYLSGDQIREVAAARPKIIFGLKTDYVKSVNICLDKKLGFKPNEIRELFLTNPSIFKSHPKALEKKFALLNGEMGIPHQSMVKYPNLLKIPEYVIAQRHAFLSSLGKAVYDPFETDFTALTAFTDFHDEGFATKVAGVDFQTYDLFLRDNNFRVAKSRCDADFAIDADHDDRDDHDDDDDDEHHDSRHRDHRRVS